MLALQSPPMSNTDREFLQGNVNGSQFERKPAHGDAYAKVAKKAGQSVKGKIYLSGLARFPGDPEAWVEGRGDVKRLIESRPGWSCDGAVTVRQPREEQSPPVDIAPSLVEELAQDAMENDPGLAEKPAEEVREKIRSKHKPHWSKK